MLGKIKVMARGADRTVPAQIRVMLAEHISNAGKDPLVPEGFEEEMAVATIESEKAEPAVAPSREALIAKLGAETAKYTFKKVKSAQEKVREATAQILGERGVPKQPE